MKKRNMEVLSRIALLVAALVTNAAEEVFPEEALPTASGYLTIKEKPGALMFYAYYDAIEPEVQFSERPIVLWLQGGPGCSGLLGNLYELGPWRVAQDLRLHKNSAPWNRLFGLLFLDNPIGSGFSVAPTDQDIPSNQEEIAEDLYSALQAFYDLNPLFKSRPFFVTGESYAGKYVPSLAYYMVEKGGSLRIDGAAIGNGLTHPVVQVQSHASVAHAMGLIDDQQKLYLETLQQKAVTLTSQQKWNEARIARNRVLRWLGNTTGLASLSDVRRTIPYNSFDNGTDFLGLFVNQLAVKEALNAHPNITWVGCSDAVDVRLREDIMKSTKWMVETLLLKIPVLLYQGQFDLRDGVVSTQDWMRTLQWNGLADFWQAERKVWRVENVQAGYVRSYSNLTHVVVARAGHYVPTDQNLHSQVQSHASVAHAMGLIDDQQKLYLETLQQKAVTLTSQQKWNEARIARNRVLRWLGNTTGLASLYDVRRTIPYSTFDNGTDFLGLFVNQRAVKEALNAPPNITWVGCSDAVDVRLREDIMKSTKWMVETLLLKIPVLLYQGQFDLRDGVVSTQDWMRTLDWNGLADFWQAERKVWRVENVQAGYVRSYSNLTHVVVARAGHYVPTDQNLHSQVMIESWVAKSLATSAVQR